MTARSARRSTVRDVRPPSSFDEVALAARAHGACARGRRLPARLRAGGRVRPVCRQAGATAHVGGGRDRRGYRMQDARRWCSSGCFGSPPPPACSHFAADFLRRRRRWSRARGVAVAAAATLAAGILLGLSALLAETTWVYGGWLALPAWPAGSRSRSRATRCSSRLAATRWSASQPRTRAGRAVAHIYAATWAFAAICSARRCSSARLSACSFSAASFWGW